MSIDDTDVVARLQAGADQVERHAFDAGQVVAGSRRALRRRRTWQAAGVGTTAVAVAFSLALAGPVPVPGLGDVALPGSEELRELFGLAKPECVPPEPTARRSPVESGTSLRPGVTFHLADARPLSTCSDVRIDGMVRGTTLSPDGLTEEGKFWKVPEDAGAASSTTGTNITRVDPFIDGIEQVMAPLVPTPVDGGVSTPGGLTPQGDEAAWFVLTAQSADEPPDRVFLAAGGRRVDPLTGEFHKSRVVSEIEGDYDGNLAVTAQRVAWRQENAPTGSSDAGDSWGMTAWVAGIESGEPRPLAERATAVGGDDDEIVVATLDQPAAGSWTTTFTSYGDDGGEQTVLTLEHLRETYVQFVDLTDDVLTYALDGGYHLAAIPRKDGVADPGDDQAIAVRLGATTVDSVSAAGDSVAWVVSSHEAYLLRDVGLEPDLVQVGSTGLRSRIVVGLAGDRIAWATSGSSYRTGETDTAATLNVGTLLGEGTTSATRPDPATPGARAVPAAPTVTVPEDAVFRTYD